MEQQIVHHLYGSLQPRMENVYVKRKKHVANNKYPATSEKQARKSHRYNLHLY